MLATVFNIKWRNIENPPTVIAIEGVVNSLCIVLDGLKALWFGG